MNSDLGNLLSYLHILRAQEEYNRNFFESAAAPSLGSDQAEAIRFVLSYIKEHDLGYLLREDLRDDIPKPASPPIPPARRSPNSEVPGGGGF